MAEHKVVKPEQIAAVAAVALEQGLVLPGLMQREGIEQYAGTRNDTINVPVEGVLPYRSYGWRADRSTEVNFDDYAERMVAVSFGGDLYSAVKLTDEQATMDIDGWTKLAGKQTDALARGLEYEAAKRIVEAPYEIELGVSTTFNYAAGTSELRKGLVRAKTTMDRLSVPGTRWLVVGTDWQDALLNDPILNLAGAVGDSQAETALGQAIIAQRMGFNIVVAQDLPTDMAVAMVDSAFIFASGAPAVPQSVPFGATASADGVAVRWIRDYDSTRFQDRSIFNLYKGFREVSDVLVGRDATDQPFVSQYEHFVRAFKLTLNGSDNLPNPDGDDEKQTELGNITGIWGAAGQGPSADEADVPATTIKSEKNQTISPTGGAKARDEA